MGLGWVTAFHGFELIERRNADENNKEKIRVPPLDPFAIRGKLFSQTGRYTSVRGTEQYSVREERQRTTQLIAIDRVLREENYATTTSRLGP